MFVIEFCLGLCLLGLFVVPTVVVGKSLEFSRLDEDVAVKIPPIQHPAQDAIYHVTGRDRTKTSDQSEAADFKYKYLAANGDAFDNDAPGRVEIAATLGISDYAHNVGTDIIRRMTRYMPGEVFSELSLYGSVGFFTDVDKTTIFPEYEHLRDRPECAGTCAGACSITCTGDGRKYDSLAGVGGSRGTCLDDNYMCTDKDPYYRQYSVLVHEFGHTIHQYALRGPSNYYAKIAAAYANAYNNAIWERTSYGMSNALEYFAEGTGVFFNTNRHPNSSGGMNGCGRPAGQFCANEDEARAWIQFKDPLLFEALSFTYTDHRQQLFSGLAVCHSI